MWKLGPGVVAFVVRLDQGEIGIIVALDSNWSTAGHKRRKREICCFYEDEFISRKDALGSLELEVSCTELNRFSHLRAHYVLFICVRPSHIPCIFAHLLLDFFSL